MRVFKLLIGIWLVAMSAGLQAQSTLALVESSGGCGLTTDCGSNTICFDIMLTPGVTAEVLSYNIWVKYVDAGLSYLSDNACITQNGTDNNLDQFFFYRVSGVNGTTQVQAGEAVSLHTICFTYDGLSDINGNTVIVGGTVFDVLFSTLTYDNPPSNEPMLPEFPFLMDENSISCLEVLPLEMLYFQAQKQGPKALLTWQTANERQNAGFLVERSEDGKTFRQIGIVDAAKGITGTATYDFTDQAPVQGLNHYRLQQMDLDGHSTYSPIRTVMFDDAGFSMRSWPNPASETLNVAISQSEGSNTTVRLISVTGQELMAEVIGSATLQKEISLTAFPPGVYQLIAESGADRIVEKIVIIDK